MEPAVLVTLVAVAVVVVLAAVAVLVRRLRSELAAVRADVAALQARLDELARRPQEPPAPPAGVGDGPEFVITSLAADTANTADSADSADSADTADPAASGVPVLDHDAGPGLVSGGRFVSVAAGESLVRVVSLAHGVRRALAPETRNRIRFEMGREVKRSRRQRRRDLKEAKRHLRTQQPGLSKDAA
jgi:low affinity Fe/Cu permease